MNIPLWLLLSSFFGLEGGEAVAIPYNTSIYFETPRSSASDELVARLKTWNQVDCVYNYMTCLHRFHRTDYCLLSLEGCTHTKASLNELAAANRVPPKVVPLKTNDTGKRLNRKPLEDIRHPKTCEELSGKASGVYKLDFNGSPKDVYCFWRGDRAFTIVQRRGKFSSPKDFFERNWNEYLRGFGDPDKEHWLGLEHITALTKVPRDLTILLSDDNEEKAAILLLNASLKRGVGGYALHYDALAAYEETSRSSKSLSASAPRSGLYFSTRDRNPYPLQTNCAKVLSGGWWFDPFQNCGDSNLNGINYGGPYANESKNGIIWKAFRGGNYSLRSTRMFIGKPRRKAAFKINLYSAKDIGVLVGEVSFEEGYGVLIMKGAILGIKKGKHGVTINEKGVLSPGCRDTGGHLNPFNRHHGAPMGEERHEGDLGNFEVFEDGAVSDFRFLSQKLKISIGSEEEYLIVGRSFVIYENEDDQGLGSGSESKGNGNTGLPLACGLIMG